MLRLFVILSAFGICFPFFSPAQTGTAYTIRVNIKNYAEPQIILGYHYGDKTYVKDTAEVDNMGRAVLDGKEKLPAGMYLLLRPSDNAYLQILVSEKEQNFTVNLTNGDKGMEWLSATGSLENKLFGDYMKFLTAKRKDAESYQEMQKNATDAKIKKQATDNLEALDKIVTKYQQDLISKNRGTLTALVIRANLSLNPPEFKGDEDEKNKSNYLWYKQHWFDNLDLSDERLVYTPILSEKVNYYIDKLTPADPDSIILSVDRVLGMAKGENFKYLLIDLLNKFAASRIVGMDAVYVHIALHYYKKNKAPWIEKEQLEKIISNAESLEPILIGKKAPALKVYTPEGKEVNLYDLEAEYTILFFWRTEPDRPLNEITYLQSAMEKYRGAGVKVFTVNTEIGPDASDNLRIFSRDNEKENWVNTGDPEGKSGLKRLYLIKTPKQLFILDKNKKILMKNISAEQLADVLSALVKKKNL